MPRPEIELHRHPSRLSAVSSKPADEAEAEYYLAQVTSVKSVDDLLSDDRLYTFVITAFGLTSTSGARGFIWRILTEPHDSKKAFAAELADQRVRDLAAAFDFASHGAQTTQRREARECVVERYRLIMLEAEAGRQDEGARLALSFARRIGGVKGIYGLLGDSDLLTVARVALGLPAVPAGAEMDRQAKTISAQINLEDFKEGQHLDAFLQRFLTQWRRSRVPAGTEAAAFRTPWRRHGG